MIAVKIARETGIRIEKVESILSALPVAQVAVGEIRGDPYTERLAQALRREHAGFFRASFADARRREAAVIELVRIHTGATFEDVVRVSALATSLLAQRQRADSSGPP